MNQGAQGYSLTKKTEGRKSRDTVPLTKCKKTAYYKEVIK
jgi:hypothetical protein